MTRIQNEEVTILARSKLDLVHIIIDMREPHEVAADPIREAVNIPLATQSINMIIANPLNFVRAIPHSIRIR